MSLDNCPVCASPAPDLFLCRNNVPANQNLVVADPVTARSCNTGRLEMMVCDRCGFVYNRCFNPALLAYGEDYDNTQSCSPGFDAYLDGLVRKIVDEHGLRNASIVEVGCGKGHFLRKLIEYPGAGNTGFGFDPSYVGADIDLTGRLHFRRCFYDDTCTNVAADVVICRHVIEHVPDPLALLKSVRSALSESPQAKVFFETPCVEWILRNRVIWDFFHEHCSLFSSGSLRLAFEQAGFTVHNVEHVFGGQYLWIVAQPGPSEVKNPTKPNKTFALAQAYGQSEAEILDQWKARLADLTGQGKTALWGAGAKGATLAHLVDPNQELIDCVVDINPNKQGKYIPGTGHPIIAPQGLVDRGVKQAVLMNPNYREENLRLLEMAGIEIKLIDWSET